MSDSIESYVDVLRQKRRTPIAILHLFRMKHARRSDDIYLFVEGADDEDFYAPFVERMCTMPRTVHSLWCDGKEGVLAVRSLVYKNFGHSTRSLFFVDKDLEDIVDESHSDDERTYVTDYYS